MLIKTRILMNIFNDEFNEDIKLKRLIDSDYDEYEDGVIGKEFRDCVISTEKQRIVVDKNEKGRVILIELEEGLIFEEDNIYDFSSKLFEGEEYFNK